MDYTLGDRIRDLREHLNMSQRELCRDICTQGLISRIETNTATPTAPVLHQIAVRLGVDLNYFFDDISRDGLNYVKEVMNTIDKYIRDQEYEQVMEIVELEKDNPLFNKKHLQQYLLWREGICVYYLHNDADHALELLDNAFNMGKSEKKFSEVEIDILASKAIIYSLIKKLDDAANIYRKIIRDVTSLRVVQNKRLVIRVLYNASRNAYDRHEYGEALDYINKALNTCIKEQQLYLLGHILFQKGSTLFRYDPAEKETCIKLLEEALWVYELDPVPAFITALKEEMTLIRQS
ncbi:helix-turn-helix domain-containing protein [Evansella clarkii]|uniref:helix-turn-helix domain-containing protein n=1 Tax=Evansella clarkii TaxID=79879 RepID=UPI000997D07F|nr:helix-turn-helix domain-containing protein [Evansella clarkii]